MPTEERLKRGERPARPPVVVGGRTIPATPTGLNRYQLTAWRTVVADLSLTNVLDRADAAVIEAFAVHWGRARQARSAINTKPRRRTRRVLSKAGAVTIVVTSPEVSAGGLLMRTSQGWSANPLLAIEERAWREIRQLADQLPLSPWGRARLGLTLATGANEGADQDMEATIGKSPRLRVVDRAG